jgi:hypothetical protein
MTAVSRGRTLLLSVILVVIAFACWWVLLFGRHGLLLGPPDPLPVRLLWIPGQVFFLGFPLLLSTSLLGGPRRWSPRFVGLYFLFGSLVAIVAAAFTRQAAQHFAVAAVSYGYCGAVVLLSKDLRTYIHAQTPRA